MGRARVPQRQLPDFLEELREKGARRVRRDPADFGGMVPVRWEDPPWSRLQERDFRADLRAWLPAHALSAAFLVLLLLVFTAIRVLTGGMAGP